MFKAKQNNRGSWLLITVGMVIGLSLILGISFLGYKFYKRMHHPSRYSKIDPLMHPKNDFSIFAASSLDKIFKDRKTLAKPEFKAEPFLTAAQNEYESFQIVISNGSKELKIVNLRLSGDVIHRQDQNKKITKDNISIRTVGFVPTKKPYYPVKYVGDWPDPLLPHQPIDIQPNTAQPFWITVYVPEGTSPGVYSGFIEIDSDSIATEMPFQIEVYDFALPKENHLKTAFDFYGHLLGMRYPGRTNEQLDQLADQYIINMLKHRMNPVLNVDPTSEKELAAVDRYRVLGLTNFSIGKKGGTFGNNWPENDEKIEQLLPLYRTYGELLSLNKLIDYQYIYTWDEGEIGNPQVAKVTSMIKRGFAKLKNMVCYHGIWNPNDHPAWGKDIDIWCFQISNFAEEQLKTLKQRGMEIWMYVSGPSGDGTPNLAIDFDTIDYRIIPWLAWKYDIQGFLYWCVNWWPLTDPFKSAANTKWEQNGNGLLFYPGEDGPIDSIRSEVFRDGMEDYEYLVVLKNSVEKFRTAGLDQKYPEVLTEAQKLLSVDERSVKSMFDFSKDQEYLLNQRNKIGKIISKMNALLK